MAMRCGGAKAWGELRTTPNYTEKGDCLFLGARPEVQEMANQIGKRELRGGINECWDRKLKNEMREKVYGFIKRKRKEFSCEFIVKWWPATHGRQRQK